MVSTPMETALLRVITELVRIAGENAPRHSAGATTSVATIAPG